MSKIAVVAVVAVVVSACTIEKQSSLPPYGAGNAIRDFIAPAFCNKQQECAPAYFAKTYGTDAACRASYEEQAKKEDGKVSRCTSAELRQCQDDYFAAQCSTSNTIGLILPLPASCTKC